MRTRLGLYTLAVIFAALLFATIANASAMTGYVNDKSTPVVTASLEVETNTHFVYAPVILQR